MNPFHLIWERKIQRDCEQFVRDVEEWLASLDRGPEVA